MKIIPYTNGLPQVTIQVQTKQKKWRFVSALIDSGAQFSIFSLSQAVMLGFSPRDSRKVKVESADGDIFDVYKTTLRAKFEDSEFSLPVGFSMKRDIMALIGRSGFFETFRVEFLEREKTTILRPYR